MCMHVAAQLRLRAGGVEEWQERDFKSANRIGVARGKGGGGVERGGRGGRGGGIGEGSGKGGRGERGGRGAGRGGARGGRGGRDKS